MKKSKIYLIVFISLIIFLVSTTIFLTISHKSPTYCSCPFCDRKVLDNQKYFEDSNVIGLYTNKPLIKGHCLIIPKRHVERFEDLNDLEQVEMLKLVKKTHLAAKKSLNVENYFLLQKNGRSAGQSVPHVHIHYIPVGKNSSAIKILYKFLVYPFNKKVDQSEMDKITSLISENI